MVALQNYCGENNDNQPYHHSIHWFNVVHALGQVNRVGDNGERPDVIHFLFQSLIFLASYPSRVSKLKIVPSTKHSSSNGECSPTVMVMRTLF